MLLSFLLSHYSKFLNKTKHTHTHTHTNFFFQKNPILLRILGLGIENPLVFLKFSLGIQEYSVLSLFLKTSLLLSFLCPTTLKFHNKTTHAHPHTHGTNFFFSAGVLKYLVFSQLLLQASYLEPKLEAASLSLSLSLSSSLVLYLGSRKQSQQSYLSSSQKAVRRHGGRVMKPRPRGGRRGMTLVGLFA